MPRLLRHLTCAIVLLSATTAVAETGGMTIQVKHSRRIALSNAVANVVVGNPAVADVAMVDQHSVVIVGKGYGSTDVLVLDRAGHTLLNTNVTVVAAGDRVTVYRGASATHFSCAPHCEAIKDDKTAEGGEASPSAPGVLQP